MFILIKILLQVLPGMNDTLGVVCLKARGLFPEARWYWIGVAALIGYTILFNFLIVLGMEYLDREHLFSFHHDFKVIHSLTYSSIVAALGDSQPTVSEEFLKEKQASIEGVTEDSDNAVHEETIEFVDASQAKKGMALPFAPLAITFDNIRYSVDMPQVSNQIQA